MILNIETFFQRNFLPVIFCLSIILTFVLFLRPAIDPDLGWHLKQGEIVLTQKRFITSDEFSHTLSNYPWRPYWLSEVFLYSVYNSFGLTVLSFIFAGLAASSFWLVAAKSTKAPNSYLVIFGALIAVTISLSFAGVRPQVISWLFFAICWVAITTKFYLKKTALVAIPLLFVLWVNLHFGFLIGIGLFGLLATVETIKFLIFKFVKKSRFLVTSTLPARELLRVYLVLLAALIASLASPYHYKIYTSALSFPTSNINTQNIMEWLPLSVRSDFGFVFLIFSLIVIYLIARFEKELFSFEIIAALLICIGAFSSIRHLPFATLVLIPILIKYWPEISFSKNSLFFLKIYFLTALLLIVAVSVYSQVKETINLHSNFEKLSQKAGYPYLAVEFLKQQRQEGEMLNEYNWGGYLIWQLPNAKTFIDGRMPGWKRADQDILADYLAIWKVTPKTDELLLKYSIDFALLSADSPIATYLKAKNWQIKYSDKISIIFAKI